MELLVVMGIIMLLIAILLPAVMRANRDAVRIRMAADLSDISRALEVYKQQFGDYPRSGSPGSPNASISGSVILSWALLAPGPATGTGSDGADGFGFRVRATGQGEVYGPYLQPDRFHIGTLSGNNVVAISNTTSYSDLNTVIGDIYGHVILYYPANLSVDPTKQYVGAYTIGTLPPTARFNYNDNNNVTGGSGNTLTQNSFKYRLGDHNENGIIDNGEIPVVTSPYILWCAGPDGLFGPKTTANSAGANVTSGDDDDVTFPENLDMLPAGMAP